MKKFEMPSINVDIFSFEDVLTVSGEPQRKSAYLAAMGSLEAKGILEQEIDVFGFENDPNR